MYVCWTIQPGLSSVADTNHTMALPLYIYGSVPMSFSFSCCVTNLYPVLTKILPVHVSVC